MLHSGRTAGIHALLEGLIAVPLAALKNIDLLPEVMNEGFGARAARIDLEQPGNKHFLGIWPLLPEHDAIAF